MKQRMGAYWFKKTWCDLRKKGNKSLKKKQKSEKEIKVQIETGSESSNRKGEIKVQIKYGKKVCDLSKKVIPKITIKNRNQKSYLT